MKELAAWRPLRELDNLKKEMDKLWDRFFREGPLEVFRGEGSISVDISETKNNLIVSAEVPGIEPGDLDISLSGNRLTIKGEKKQIKEEKDESYHRIERRYGSFSRTIELPVEVDSSKVDATYKNGILKIVLPKVEKEKAREIKIKVE
jgi:HSP20 family protein